MPVRALVCFPILITFLMFAPTVAKAQPPTTKPTTRPHNFARWEKEIAGIEKRDAANPPPKGALLFIGASNVRIWKTLPQDFPDHSVINHGFGGSEIIDATHFADRLIFPDDPSMVLLRSGSNDIHAGMSPQEVFGDYKDFVATVHARLPKATIVFISMNACPSRWAERDKDKEVNQLIEDYTKAHAAEGLAYIETYDLMLDPNGNPRRELFLRDMLHLNPAGYKLLAARVREQLPKQ